MRISIGCNGVPKQKFRFFKDFTILSKKLKLGHVQDSPVSTNMISNEYMVYHMKVHIVSYNLGPKNISKSKIHILPNYGQTDSKTAIV